MIDDCQAHRRKDADAWLPADDHLSLRVRRMKAVPTRPFSMSTVTAVLCDHEMMITFNNN